MFGNEAIELTKYELKISVIERWTREMSRIRWMGPFLFRDAGRVNTNCIVVGVVKLLPVSSVGVSKAKVELIAMVGAIEWNKWIIINNNKDFIYLRSPTGISMDPPIPVEPLPATV